MIVGTSLMEGCGLKREGLIVHVHPHRGHAWLILLLLLRYVLLVRLGLVEVLLRLHVLLGVKHGMLVHTLLRHVGHVEVQNYIIGVQFDYAVLVGFLLLLLHPGPALVLHELHSFLPLLIQFLGSFRLPI